MCIRPEGLESGVYLSIYLSQGAAGARSGEMEQLPKGSVHWPGGGHPQMQS